MDLTADQVAGSGVPPAQKTSRNNFRFHGTGSEYFRIWIVNLCLTILTLGIYSPWAKVRKNRYIYGSLELDQSYFDYHAQPLQILRGRLAAVALLLVYVAVEYFLPFFGGILFALLTLVTPWLIVRSRMFNMRYTSYRNIRFGFEPAYAEAYTAIFGYGLFLSGITLGLAIPWAHMKRNQLLVDNTRFGTLRMWLPDATKSFYFAYFRGFMLFVALMSLLGILVAARLAMGGDSVTADLQFILPAIVFLIFYYVVGKFVAACVLQLTTNGTNIGSTRGGEGVSSLGCDWKLTGMLGIYLTNLLAIACSFGLLIPWAQMRVLRYQMNHTWVEVSGSLDEVCAAEQTRVSAFGEEIGEVFDVDIGL